MSNIADIFDTGPWEESLGRRHWHFIDAFGQFLAAGQTRAGRWGRAGALHAAAHGRQARANIDFDRLPFRRRHFSPAYHFLTSMRDDIQILPAAATRHAT